MLCILSEPENIKHNKQFSMFIEIRNYCVGILKSNMMDSISLLIDIEGFHTIIIVILHNIILNGDIHYSKVPLPLKALLEIGSLRL